MRQLTPPIANALTDPYYSRKVGIAHGMRRLALGHWSQSQWAFFVTYTERIFALDSKWL